MKMLLEDMQIEGVTMLKGIEFVEGADDTLVWSEGKISIVVCKECFNNGQLADYYKE